MDHLYFSVADYVYNVAIGLCDCTIFSKPMAKEIPMTPEEIKEFDRESKKSDHFCQKCHDWNKKFIDLLLERQRAEFVQKLIKLKGRSHMNFYVKKINDLIDEYQPPEAE